eukprot:2600499-Pyramimonas_sp.AAC.1
MRTLIRLLAPRTTDSRGLISRALPSGAGAPKRNCICQPSGGDALSSAFAQSGARKIGWSDRGSDAASIVLRETSKASEVP